MLESLFDHTPLDTVTAEHTGRALDDLLDSGQQVTRTLLGVGNDPDSATRRPGAGSGSAAARPARLPAYGLRGRPHYGP